MTPEEYRKWRPKYAQYNKTFEPLGEIPEHINTLEHQHLQAAIIGLAAEAGELLGVLQKANRKGIEINRDRVLDELSDVRWYYQYVMDCLETDDDGVTDYNKKKLDDRNR